MVTILKKFYKNTITSIQIMYQLVRGIDYRILNHYVLKINQMQDIDGIIYQASRCLSYILNYQLFAFAIHDKENNSCVDVWVHPKVDRSSVTRIINKDFSSEDQYHNIRYFNHTEEEEQVSHNIHMDNVLSYQVMNSQVQASLYLIPQNMMLHHHSELLDILIKTLETSISNLIHMKKLENAALIDPLTRCYNRRALTKYIDHFIANAIRYESDLSVVMFDIDHFKQVNDTYGHKAGDIVLQEVSKNVLSAVRKGDYLVRYGGEEFLVVLPETKFSKAIELAERLRKRIEHLEINIGNETIQVTVSIGVAPLKKGMDKNDLLKKVDDMLYKAKKEGRNRIKPDLRLCDNSPGYEMTIDDLVKSRHSGENRSPDYL